MAEQQTFYAVLDEDGDIVSGVSFENANKAEHVARRESERFPDHGAFRVIAYTVIATFGGTDD